MNIPAKKTRLVLAMMIVNIWLAACGDSTSTPPAAATEATPVPQATPLSTVLAKISLSSLQQTPLTPTQTTLPPTTNPGYLTLTIAALPTPTLPPTVPAGVPNCRAAALEARAFWQGATGSMAGAVVFSNKTTNQCSLAGRPVMELIDANKSPVEIQMASFGNADGGLALKTGQEARSFFVWRNWCGSRQLALPLTLIVVLPGNQEQLSVPVLDPDGQPAVSFPRCDAPDIKSTISVGPFEANNP